MTESSVAFTRACTLSTVTPLETPAMVASTSSAPPAVPFRSGRSAMTAGSNPLKAPFALTCAVSFAIEASNVSVGIVPPRIDVSVSVPFAVTSIVSSVVPRAFATT